MRSYITYTSLKSVLQDIYSMVDSIDWDEDKMFEWALKGLRKINIPAKLEDAVFFIPIEGHRGELPGDIKYINQAFYKVDDNYQEADLEAMMKAMGITEKKPFYKHMSNPSGLAEKALELLLSQHHYTPLRRSSGSFGVDPCVHQPGKIPTYQCNHKYTIISQSFIETSFKEGCVIMSYKRYIKDCDGVDMVPDNEDLKDALFHFCMYRWWMSRMTYKEEGSERQMSFHLQQYKELGRKASANLSMPDIDTLENIKNTRDRLVPRTNLYDTGFGRLSNRENIPF